MLTLRSWSRESKGSSAEAAVLDFRGALFFFTLAMAGVGRGLTYMTPSPVLAIEVRWRSRTCRRERKVGEEW